jgi:hypothetical protein
MDRKDEASVVADRLAEVQGENAAQAAKQRCTEGAALFVFFGINHTGIPPLWPECPNP